MASSTSLLNTPAFSHSVRRLRKVVSPAGVNRAATSQEQPVTSRSRIPVKQSRSGTRGRWQPSGWVSGGRGGRWPWTAAQTASTTRGSSASTGPPAILEPLVPEVLILQVWLLQAGRCGMTSRTGRRVGPATIERRRAKITAEIATLGLPLPGSLVERRTRCGGSPWHLQPVLPQRVRRSTRLPGNGSPRVALSAVILALRRSIVAGPTRLPVRLVSPHLPA